MCKWKDFEFWAKIRRIRAAGGRIFGADVAKWLQSAGGVRAVGWGVGCGGGLPPGVRGCSVGVERGSGNGKAKTGAVQAVGEPTHAAKDASWGTHEGGRMGWGKGCAWAKPRVVTQFQLQFRMA